MPDRHADDDLRLETLEGLEQFVRGIDPGLGVDERRRSPRVPLIAKVVAIPIDRDKRPIGEPFIAVSRNISAGGISMFHRHASPSTFLSLQIVRPIGPPSKVLMRVVRNRRVDAFFEIAGEFIKDPRDCSGER
jgi:hypothetical protein